jgi:hypothetical protein
MNDASKSEECCMKSKVSECQMKERSPWMATSSNMAKSDLALLLRSFLSMLWAVMTTRQFLPVPNMIPVWGENCLVLRTFHNTVPTSEICQF